MELLETFDLLGTGDELMEYVTVYASGKAGWATIDMDIARELAQSDSDVKIKKEYSMKVLFQPPIISSVKEESNSNDDNDEEKSFALATMTVGFDNFLGQMYTGRI